MANNKKLAEVSKATQFSSNNQPENRGRKPSVLSYIKGSGLSLDDYRKLLTNLIWEYDHKELSAILKDKNNKIPIGMTIVLGALLEDQKKRNIDNYDKFMDRCFGKSKASIDLKANMDIGPDTLEKLNAIFHENNENKKTPRKNSHKKTG
jgi:hypothetical protein